MLFLTLVQVLDGSVCAGYVSSCCLGSQRERSVSVREPHRDREALELEEQLQVLAPLPAAAFLFWCICLCLRCCSHLYCQGGGCVAAAAAAVGQEHHSTFALITEAVHTLTISLR